MEKKSIQLCLLFLSIILCLTGCGKKKAITAEEFKTFMEAKEYEISDGFDLVRESKEEVSYLVEYVQEYIIASSRGEFQIDFLEFDSIENAKIMFVLKARSIKERHENYVKEGENDPIYDMISIEDDLYISRIDNTMLFVYYNKNSKSVVKKLIKKLGY